MMSIPSILSTKLYFPLTRENLVSRPRLVEHLHNGLNRRLILISAPAGYGKTTLMSEWRGDLGKDYFVAWLSLDNDDTDLTAFYHFRYVTEEPEAGNISTGVHAGCHHQFRSFPV